jgi:serine/threonine protein kinase
VELPMYGKALIAARKSQSSVRGLLQPIIRPPSLRRFVLRAAHFIAYTQEHLWAPQSFFEEAVIWGRLRHPNIVPFVGITTDLSQVVSEWMPNGNMREFIERNPGTDRIGLVGLRVITLDL